MNIFNHLLACLALCLFVAGCGEDEPTNPNETHDHAEFLFFHAATTAPSVDVSVDGTTTLSDRTYTIINNDYAELEAGTRTIAVTQHGGTTSLASTALSFTKDEHYTLFLGDTPGGTVSLLQLHDNLTEPAAGKAHIRLVYLAPGGPAGIKLAIPGSGQGPIISNVKYMDTTESFIALNAGQTTFRVQNAATSGGGGGGGGGGNVGLFDDFTVTLEEGKIYTIAVVGSFNNDAVTTAIIEHKHD